MASTPRDRAVLFADLVGSTRLYDELGDHRAHAVTAGCLRGIIETVERFGGIVVKTIGDEVMATLLTADAALSCAEAIVSGVHCTGLETEKPLGVRVGFHYGPVIEDAGDVFGNTVNVAARMEKLCKEFGTAIILSEAAVLQLGEGFPMQDLGLADIRGKDQAIRLYGYRGV